MKLFLYFLLFWPLLLHSSIDLTKNERDWIKSHPTILVGGEMDWVPFDFVDKDGSYTGITSDYLNLIAKKSGLNFKVVTGYTWAELVEKFKQRELDVLPAVFYSKKREAYGIYTKPYYSTTNFLFVKKESTISSFEDLKGKKLAIPAGYTVIPEIKNRFPDIEVVETQTLLDGIYSVLNGDADASFEVQAVMASTLKENAIVGIKGVGQTTFDATPLHLLVRKDYTPLVSIVNKTIHAITQQEKDKIFHRWISLKISQEVDYTFLLQLSAVLFVIIALIIYRQQILKKHNIALKKAKEEAENANKSKSDFLAMMSHEIRTPMNAIVGFSDFLMNSSLDTKQEQYVKTIKNSSKLLLEIINDILDFSKIESGKLEIESYEFNLHELLNDISNVFNDLMSEKRINFELKKPNELPHTIKADQIRLKQIIFNLLSNALKFTDEKGSILLEVNFNDLNNRLTIAVTDSGIGISGEKLAKIFEAFTQEDTSTTRKYGGTGLGLTISLKLVELMGGTMNVKSSVGKGSTFSFNIPVQKTHSALESKSDPAKTQTLTFDLSSKILIAEDNKTNQLMLSIILDELGVSYDLAKDGVEAFNMCSKNDYSLIFMDENMPNMSGIESTQKIRTLKKDRHIPIVAVTANAMVDDRKRFLDAGLDDYISKPYSQEDVLNVLKKFLH